MKKREAPSIAALAAELEALSSEFAAMRRARPHPRAPFPLELLQRACELDAAAPALGVLRHLHLDSQKVWARVRVGGAAGRAAAKAARAKPRPDERQERHLAFVEVPLAPASTARPVVVTVDRGEGLRITLEIASERAESAVSLITSLIGGAA